MMPNIEEAKQKMKDEYAQKVDEFFEHFAEREKNQRLDINGIEALLGKGIADAKEVLISTSEVLIKTEANEQEGKKKSVRSAEKR